MILAESRCVREHPRLQKNLLGGCFCRLALEKNHTTAAELKLFVSARVAEIQDAVEVDDFWYIKAPSTIIRFRLKTDTFWYVLAYYPH